MVTRVKICGITRAEDAGLAIELGAFALGFNFYPQSPRYITPKAAWEIARNVPAQVMSVGIFADVRDMGDVLSVADESGVGAIQLHGVVAGFAAVWSESGRRYPVIQAVAVDNGFQPGDVRTIRAGAVLLDAGHPTLKGGTGRIIDWAKAREVARHARVILAGGLTPDNVGEAIRQVRPFAVDVASGVESAPGLKDASKLRAFFSAVAEADRS